jgi:predicted methyltransferase MtxX (methanogen marker protein 4)
MSDENSGVVNDIHYLIKIERAGQSIVEPDGITGALSEFLPGSRR